MSGAEYYLRELENQLIDKMSISNDWEFDERFKTKREKQSYNNGITEGLKLIREMLDSDDFKSPFARMFSR